MRLSVDPTVEAVIVENMNAAFELRFLSAEAGNRFLMLTILVNVTLSKRSSDRSHVDVEATALGKRVKRGGDLLAERGECGGEFAPSAQIRRLREEPVKKRRASMSFSLQRGC